MTFAPLPDDELLPHLEAVQFEVTSACNLRCAMCPREICPAVRAKPGRHMPRALFEKAVDDLVRAGIHLNAVYPFWLGESTLHPEFAHLFEYLMSKNFANSLFECVEFDTNGLLLDEPLARALLSYRRMQCVSPATFLRLYVSIDAATRATYEAIRVGGEFARVEANVERFLDLREASGTERHPRLALQMVVQEANAGEVAAFCRRWRDRFARRGLPLSLFQSFNKDAFGPLARAGDAVFLRPLYTSPAAQPEADRVYRAAIRAAADELAREGMELRRASTEAEDALHHGVVSRAARPRAGVCRYLMTRPLVTAAGLVLPCFNDDTEELALGSLAESDFLAVWNGERANALRAAHAAGRHPERCAARCDGFVPFDPPAPEPRAAGEFRLRL